MEVQLMSEFTTEPCAICGGVQKHLETCPYDPTWEPGTADRAGDGYWDLLPTEYLDREGQAHECPTCGRLYAYPENADRCPCG
jgi:hypothetical protein